MRPGLLCVVLVASPVGPMARVASAAPVETSPRTSPASVASRVASAAPGETSPPTSTAPADRSLHIDWSAPAGCPRGDEVRDIAGKLLGRPLTAGEPATTQVRARVRAGAGGFVLTIETRSSSGTDRRKLQDARCAVLAEAAAVIAATAVDPSLAPVGGLGVADDTGDLSSGPGLVPAPPGDEPPLSPGTGDEPPAVVGEPPPVVSGPPTDLSPGTAAAPAIAPAIQPAPAVADDEPPPRAPPPTPVAGGPRFGLRLAGVFDIGSVPGPTGGLALTGALLGRLWRAELTALWLAPRTGGSHPTLDVGAQVQLFAGQLRGCVVPRVRKLEVPVCGGLEAGVLRGRGVGAALVQSTVDNLPWLAISAGPGLAYAVRPRLAVTLQVDLVVPLLIPSLVASGEEAYRGAPAAGRALLGLEWRLR